MEKNDKLSEKLLKENGSTTDQEFDRLIGDIQKMIHKQKFRLSQDIWITCALWLGVLISRLLKLPFGPSELMVRDSGNPNDAFHLYLSIFVVWLLPAAIISTIILLIRRWYYSTREINLRMKLLEVRLLKQEKGGGDKS